MLIVNFDWGWRWNWILKDIERERKIKVTALWLTVINFYNVWNFPRFSPIYFARRRARKISKSCRNCSQGSCSHFYFPLEMNWNIHREYLENYRKSRAWKKPLPQCSEALWINSFELHCSSVKKNKSAFSLPISPLLTIKRLKTQITPNF